MYVLTHGSVSEDEGNEYHDVIDVIGVYPNLDGVIEAIVEQSDRTGHVPDTAHLNSTDTVQHVDLAWDESGNMIIEGYVINSFAW